MNQSTTTKSAATEKQASQVHDTFLGDRSSLWLLLPMGDNEYGDDSAATGLAELNRY